MNARDEPLLTVAEVAAIFKQTSTWVYRNRWGFLRPAARPMTRRLLMFDRQTVEAIIDRSKG